MCVLEEIREGATVRQELGVLDGVIKKRVRVVDSLAGVSRCACGVSFEMVRVEMWEAFWGVETNLCRIYGQLAPLLFPDVEKLVRSSRRVTAALRGSGVFGRSFCFCFGFVRNSYFEVLMLLDVGDDVTGIWNTSMFPDV